MRKSPPAALNQMPCPLAQSAAAPSPVRSRYVVS
jgi:hypothetical protein